MIQHHNGFQLAAAAVSWTSITFFASFFNFSSIFTNVFSSHQYQCIGEIRCNILTDKVVSSLAEASGNQLATCGTSLVGGENWVGSFSTLSGNIAYLLGRDILRYGWAILFYKASDNRAVKGTVLVLPQPGMGDLCIAYKLMPEGVTPPKLFDEEIMFNMDGANPHNYFVFMRGLEDERRDNGRFRLTDHPSFGAYLHLDESLLDEVEWEKYGLKVVR